MSSKDANDCLVYLENKKFVFSIRDDEQEHFLPTHLGLNAYRQPEQFIMAIYAPTMTASLSEVQAAFSDEIIYILMQSQPKGS